MEKKLKSNSELFKNIYSRGAVVINVNEEERSAELVVATEQPVVVWDWSTWQPVREIVLVDGLRYPDSLVMLDAHSRFSTNDIKGSVKDFEKQRDYEKLGTVLLGTAYFSKTAEKEWTLRQEGHLTDSSIGYRVNEKETIIIPAGGKGIVNGKEYKNDYNDGLPLYIRTGADLLEVSLVPIGADQAAKFRSQFSDGNDYHIRQENKYPPLSEEAKNFIKSEIINSIKEKKMKTDENGNPVVEITIEQERENNRKAEEKRLADIDVLHKDWKDKVKGVNLDEVRDQFKSLGASADKFSDFILENIVGQHKEAAAKPTVDLTRKNVQEYSITRAISAMLNGDNSLELEISAEYAKETGRKIEGGKRGASFFIPHTVVEHLNKTGRFGKRDVNTTATTGGEFVGTDHLGSEWIDVLRNMMVLTDLGVTYLPGRKGNIEIPKLSSGNTFGWAATENAALSESSPVTTEVTMSPKRGGTYVDISKQAILQSDPALDVILTQDGRATMARGFDAGALHGTGSSGQFTGIVSVSGVGNTSLASVNWQGLLDAIKTIKAANAALGPLRFCTNAAVEAVLRGRAKESGYPIYLMSDDGRIAGRETFISEQVNSGYLFLGAWNQAYLAMWDALDVTVDPYTLATTNQVRITFNQLADFAVRYPGAFYYASDVD